jgi:hypothetical protein
VTEQRAAGVDETADTIVAATEEPTREPGSPRWRRPAILALVAFLVYLLGSFVLWALPIGAHLATRHLGTGGNDVRIYVWAVTWTPHAIANGLDPFRTDLVFAPGGIDLTWVTTIPGPALVLWPVTEAFGPLASVNLLMLLAPALAGWAGFLVCRRVTGSFWPSLAGGYLMGFSSYMVAQMWGHANLVLIFPAILGVYLVVRRVEGSLGRVAFIAFTVLAIVGLFSISTELVATASLFGALALLGAWAFGGEARARILRAGLETAAAYVVAAALLLPVLIPALRNAPTGSVRPPERASVDLLSFVVPRTGTLIGGERYRDISSDFTSNPSEDGAYLGIVLIAMLVAFAITERRRRETWLLLGFAGLVGLLSLGPALHIRGIGNTPLPGALVTNAPLLEHATPQRFSAYLWLPVGVIAAIWLARAERGWAWPRWAVVVLGAITLLPLVESPPRGREVVAPAFFADGTFRSHLRPNEIVFAIPTMKGDEMLWQATADFAFRMPQGYTGPVPEGYAHEALARGLALHRPSPFVPPIPVVQAYLDDHQVTAVVSSDAATPKFRALLTAAGWSPERVQDVVVWRRSAG